MKPNKLLLTIILLLTSAVAFSNRHNNVNDGQEETPYFVIILAVIMIIGVIVLFFSIVKDFFSFVLKIPEFSIFYRYNEKHLRYAYKVIGCHVIHSDANNKQDQYRYLISYLHNRFRNAGKLDTNELFRLHLYYNKPERIFSWLNKHLNSEEKLQFIDYLVDLAFFNEKLSKRELHLIYNAGQTLGVSKKEVKSILTIRYQFYQEKAKKAREQRRRSSNSSQQSKRNTNRAGSIKNSTNEALKILGLSPGKVDKNEVRKAYRNMVKKHHPDRFHNKSKEEQQKAHERFIALNKAYEYLNTLT